jgi:hypothetical protein
MAEAILLHADAPARLALDIVLPRETMIATAAATGVTDEAPSPHPAPTGEAAAAATTTMIAEADAPR